MNKRTLMLSAATVALMAAPAMAAGPTTISTVVTTPQSTSTTGDLTIASGGGIKLSSATSPLVTLNSNNAVIVSSGATLTAINQSTATVFLIDGTKNATGSFETNGTIDASGTGTGKIILHMQAATAGSFTGPITFDPAQNVTLNGDQGTGILQDALFTLNGDVTLSTPRFSLTPTSANGASASSISIAQFLGPINGNVSISVGSAFTAIGNGASGITIGGHMTGTFKNSGSVAISGVAARSTKAANAESGSALIIGNSIDGGILNEGPDSTLLPSAANISSNGVNTTPTVLIVSQSVPIVLGKDAADTNTLGAASFINRGAISAVAEDPNQNITRAIQISGGVAAPITFAGDFFNSGIISSQATSTATGSPVTATAIEIDAYVNIPNLHFSGQSSTGGNGLGSVTAAVIGPQGGIAQAILIAGAPATFPTAITQIPTITIDKGASIVARANVTDPSNIATTSLAANAIRDVSNSLTTLNNAGTILAQATTLTNGNISTAHAVDVSANSVGLNFMNTGTVTGDVLFGSGSDKYTIVGTGLGVGQLATHAGAVDFGSGGNDQLNVGAFSNVAGTITASGGTLAVDIAKTGTLSVQNATATLLASTVHVAGGVGTNVGTLNVTVSQSLASTGVIAASTSAVFDLGANLVVHYGSFLPTGGTFTLISAPTGGGLTVDPADVARFSSQMSGTSLPFLFNNASVQRVNNVGGRDALQLTVSAKTASQIGLRGYAVQMFPLANAALVSDNSLGSALIAGINSQAQAQAAYDAFAPDVSGGTRAVAISLTDQATGVVAARQRQLRLFSKQPGELTLWANEFGEEISTHGQTVHGIVDGAGVISPTLPAGTVCPAAGCPMVVLNGFKDHGFGFSLGLDSGAADIGWYGAAFTFYTGDIVQGGDGLSKTSTLWYLLTAYTDWRGRGLFVDSQFTAGIGQLKGKRTIDLTIPASGAIAASTFTREADSKRASEIVALGLTTGAVLKFGSTVLTPQLAFDGMSLREEGFTEIKGGTGFDLAVKPYYANSLRAFLGTEMRQDLKLGDFTLQPSARVGYRFDFINDPVKLHASFADINSSLAGNQPGTLFTIRGPDPGRGNVVGGVNLNATTEDWTIGISYDFVRGSNNATEQVGTFSLLGRI